MFNLNKTKSVLLTLVVVLAMAGGALAAAPTVDTETTNTATTTELNDAGTQAYNATTSTYLNWSADSPNASIEITQDGDTVLSATPEAGTSVDTGTDGTADLWYYNVSLADDGSDYSGLEVGAGESVTLNVTLTNNTEVDSPDTTAISFTYSNTEDRALIASENPESEEAGGLFGGFSANSLMFWSSSSSDSETQDVGTVLSTDSTTITENTSEVRLDTLNSNLTDAYAASTSDAAEGDLIWSSYTQVSTGDDAQYVPVFYQSAGDQSWLNTSEDAYATISSDGSTMTVHNPNALLDDGQSSATLDVTTVGDEALGWGNARSMLSADMYDASTTDVWTSTFGALDIGGDPQFVTDALEA